MFSVEKTYGQCPTGDCSTRTLDVNYDALPPCGSGVVNLSGDIKAGQCLDGSPSALKCFRFIFTRTNTTSVQSFTLNFGQGQGCNGELDASYTLINGVCTKLSSGGSQTVIQFDFPVGVNQLILFGCVNSSANVSLCNLCRVCGITGITCPTAPATVFNCNNPIPAPVTTIAGFQALGGTITGIPCGTLRISSTTTPINNCTTTSVTRTYSIYDDKNNNNMQDAGETPRTCTIVYNYAPDRTAPTITCVAQTTPLDCPATPVFTPPTATDACDASVSITFTDAPDVAGACAGTFTRTRTWTATDDCMNTSTCSRSIVVRDVTAPIITCATQTTPINCPAVPAFVAPTATDACDATVAITFIDAPDVAGACAGTYTRTRTWTATDDCMNTTTCSRSIVVRDVTAPIISCATQTTPIDCPATPVFVAPTATDACDATVAITFIDAPDVAGACAGTYTRTRTWTATDDCGNTSTCSRSIVVRDVTAPTITCAAQTSPVDCQNTPVFVAPTATDLCDASVAITFVDAPIAPGACAGNFTLTRTWTATDDCGNTSTCSRSIIVRDVTAPIITCATQTTPINCPAVPAFVAPTATDACDATVAITFIDAPDVPGACAGTYTRTRTWTATDDCGNTSTCSRSIVVRDVTAPIITCATQTTPINCPAVPAFVAPTATDACDATVTITFIDAPDVAGACAGTYTRTRTWTATDDCGNTSTCSRSIVVRDVTAPIITCATQTTPVACPALPVFVAPTATDACDATVAITFIDAPDVPTAGTCAGNFTRTRTWTATDDCGNTSTCSRSIVVTCPCGTGCTYTQGYWKTHSRKGPAPYDDNWKKLGVNEENTIFFLSGMTYYEVFHTSPRGNPYYILAHQYMAAQLNILSGASAPASVTTAMTAATTLFNTYTPAQVGQLSSTIKNQFTSLASILDQYNNGIIRPGHCDELTMRGAKSNDELMKFDKLLIKPNPANNFIDLNFDAEIEGNSTILVSEISGKILSKTDYKAVKGFNSTSIDVHNIANGTYIIMVKISNRQLTERLIIIK